MHRLFVAVGLALSIAVITAGCQASTAAPTAQDAKQFLDEVDTTLTRLALDASRAGWVAQNFITEDTEALDARATQAFSDATSRCAKEAVRFDKVEVPADQRRQLNLLKVSLVLATPSDPKESEELTKLVSSMRGVYGKGKWCPDPAKPDTCMNIDDITQDAWRRRATRSELRAGVGGLAHDLAADAQGLRALRRAVEQGRARSSASPTPARCGASKYDMPPDDVHEGARSAVGAGAAALPVAARLRAHEAAREVRRRRAGRTGPIPGAPARQHLGAGLVERLRRSSRRPNADAGYLAHRHPEAPQDRRRSTWCETGERFFTSLGFAPLPQTFWERSLFVKPQDRDVVCHASAWDIDYVDDLRIKMCIEPTAEDFIDDPPRARAQLLSARLQRRSRSLFRDSANDGFHEAIGDTIALSVTPEYLVKIGLLDKAPDAVARHRPAADARAREGRVPAVRPADRPVALEGVLRRDHAGATTTRRGGSCG